MNEKKGTEDARDAHLSTEIEYLRKFASTSISSCDVAKLIAVSDERVRELLRHRLRSGDVPTSVRCLSAESVYFGFSCAPGTICLVPRGFLVIVDVANRIVREITDPFDPDERSHITQTVSAPLTTLRQTLAQSAYVGRTDGTEQLPALQSFVTGDVSIKVLSHNWDAPSFVLPPNNTVEQLQSYVLTVEVPLIAYKALLFGNTRFDFSGRDRQDVTLPTAGTYQFDLVVKDSANRPFSYTVSTNTGSSLKQNAQTNAAGDNTLRLQVTVP